MLVFFTVCFGLLYVFKQTSEWIFLNTCVLSNSIVMHCAHADNSCIDLFPLANLLIHTSVKLAGFLAIPMIFLQVVQLLSQACCLPLPELLKVKAQLSNAKSRETKRY
jgi:hypothetical protein